MAGALGTGLRLGEVAISIGTSGTVFAQSEHPVEDPTGTIAGFADAAGRYLPLVCTLNASLRSPRPLAGCSPWTTPDSTIWPSPPRQGPTVWCLCPTCRRTHTEPTEGDGYPDGIRSDVSRELLARAAFEGVVCGLLEGVDALEAAGVPTGPAAWSCSGAEPGRRAYRR